MSASTFVPEAKKITGKSFQEGSEYSMGKDIQLEREEIDRAVQESIDGLHRLDDDKDWKQFSNDYKIKVLYQRFCKPSPLVLRLHILGHIERQLSLKDGALVKLVEGMRKDYHPMQFIAGGSPSDMSTVEKIMHSKIADSQLILQRKAAQIEAKLLVLRAQADVLSLKPNEMKRAIVIQNHIYDYIAALTDHTEAISLIDSALDKKTQLGQIFDQGKPPQKQPSFFASWSIFALLGGAPSKAPVDYLEELKAHKARRAESIKATQTTETESVATITSGTLSKRR